MLLLASPAGAARLPTLGRTHGPFQQGYGRVRPATIFGGGDPTGLVQHVHWVHWGQPETIGRGIADFVWPGQSVAGGSVLSPATIVAYDLGRCGGHLAYRKLSWYFPEYGQRFERQQFMGICGNGYSPYRPPTACGPIAIVSPEGFAESVSAQGLSCPEALGLVANSPAVSYLYSGGRFVYSNLYCGTEGYKPEFSSPPVTFECARGPVSVSFSLDL